MSDSNNGEKTTNNSFAESSEGKQQNLISEFIAFIRQNKKFWMIPLLVALLGLGFLVILGGTSAAPFIYTLF